MEWTDERVETLKALWIGGNSATEVSRHLGVTRNAVIGKVHRLGLGGRLKPATPRAAAAKTPHRTRSNFGWMRAATPRPKPVGTSEFAQTATPSPRPRYARPSAVDLPDFAPTANLLSLDAHSCRWPIGHPDHPEFGFCGRERPSNVPYCAHHRKLAFRRSSLSSADIGRLVSTQ
jgi:GcrA cell cycle regulator